MMFTPVTTAAASARLLLCFHALFVAGLLWLAVSSRGNLAAALAALALWCAAIAANAVIAAPGPEHAGRSRLRRIADRLLRWTRGLVLPLGGAGALALAWLAWTRPVSTEPASLGFALALLVAAFAGFFLHTYRQLGVATGFALPWRSVVATATLRAAAFLCLATAGVLFAGTYSGLPLPQWWTVALLLLLACWLLETPLRAFARLLQPPRVSLRLPPLGAGFLLLPFFEPAARAAFRTPVASDTPTLSLPEMWFLPTLRRMLLPLAGASALLFWLGTCLHEVPFGHAGLSSRLGRLAPEPLAPGFHLTLPAPIDEVIVLPREQLREVVLGLRSDTGRPILWDREHYLGEENQLVGHGEDFLTISVPIFYYVSDPIAYHRQTTGADRIIRDLARQELLRETLHRSAFEIMTAEREALATRLRDRVQQALDARGYGVHIAQVCLRDVHPPVQVAPTYQEVVSALEEKEGLIHDGESYRAETRPRTESDVARVRLQAETVLAKRLAEVRAQAASFTSLHASFQQSPEVFRIRAGYEAFDQSLRGVRKLIVDDSLRGQLPSVLDLRRVLNPDFQPELPPDTPSLIPSLGAPLTDFTRAIEGHLRMGVGAIPATNPETPRDNPLETGAAK